MPVYHSVLNVKALVGTSNQEKALVGEFSVIVKTSLINRYSSDRNVCIQVLESAEKFRSDGQSQVPAVCDRIQQGSTAGQLDSKMGTFPISSTYINGFICRDLAPWKA